MDDTLVSTFRFWMIFTLLLAGPALGALGAEEDDLEQSLARVDSLRTHGHFRAALARLDELARELDEPPEVLWRQAILWADLGKEADGERRTLTFSRQALSVAEKALAVDSANGWAHVAKAVAAGRVAKGENSTKKSIQLSREVKQHADRAIELDSTLGAAYHVRARWHREVADLNFMQRVVVKTVYGGLPEASLEQAVADFRTAIDLERRAYHHLEIAKTYEKMGRTEEAKEALQAALDAPYADPFDPEYKQEARRHLTELR